MFLRVTGFSRGSSVLTVRQYPPRRWSIKLAPNTQKGTSGCNGATANQRSHPLCRGSGLESQASRILATNSLLPSMTTTVVRSRRHLTPDSWKLKHALRLTMHLDRGNHTHNTTRSSRPFVDIRRTARRTPRLACRFRRLVDCSRCELCDDQSSPIISLGCPFSSINKAWQHDLHLHAALRGGT